VEFGRGVPADLVPSSKPCRPKKTAVLAYLKSPPALRSSEGEFGPSVAADLKIDRLDEIEVAAVPEVCLDDPPRADDPAAGGGAHAATPISFGARTRL
jgi:hypothetical protein